MPNPVLERDAHGEAIRNLTSVTTGVRFIFCEAGLLIVPISKIVSVHRAPHLLRYRALEVQHMVIAGSSTSQSEKRCLSGDYVLAPDDT